MSTPAALPESRVAIGHPDCARLDAFLAGSTLRALAACRSDLYVHRHTSLETRPYGTVARLGVRRRSGISALVL